MKALFTLAFISLAPFLLFSQIYRIDSISGTTLAACSGKFTDAGGPGGAYGSNQYYVTTLCSDFSTGNPSVKLYFNQFDIDLSDTLYIYDGLSAADPLIGKYNNSNSLFLHPVQATVMNWSGCLTVYFTSDPASNAGGWNADISCIPLCQQVFVGLDTNLTSPHLNDTGYITACPNDTMHFVGVGVFPQNNILYLQQDTTSTFIWSFGDGVVDTGRFVQHHYDSVRGYDVQLTIIDEMGCVSTNALGLRVCLSDKPIQYLQQPPAVCQYDSLTLFVGYLSGSNVTVDPIHHEQSSSLKYDSATFIPDGGYLAGQCYNTNVTFNVFMPGQTIQSAADILSVSLNMEHSFVGDLQMNLICPNGQTAVMKEYIQQGGAYLGIPYGGDNHQSFDCTSPPSCLTDPAQNPAGTGWTYVFTPINPEYNTMQSYANTGNTTPLPPGINNATIDSSSYLPFEDFNSLIGCPLNGTWNLQICDYWAVDNGWVFWWQLNLDPNLLPGNWGYTCRIDSCEWSGPFMANHTDSTLTIYPTVAGNYQYTVTLIDNFGCSYDTTLNVQVNPAPFPGLPEDITVCDGESASFSTQGSGNVLWNTGATTPLLTVTPSDTTTYTVELTAFGCTGYDTITVNVNPIPLASAGADTSLCLGQSITLSGSGGLQYQWNTGALTPTVTLTPASTATYIVTVSSNGCSSSDTVLVIVNPIPYPQLGQDVAICEGDSVLLTPGTFTSYQWSTGSDQPQLIADLHGTYWVDVFNEYGCTGSDTLYLTVNPVPQVSFDFDPAVGCEPFEVNFLNYTQPQNVAYIWHFGDGKSSTEINPLHTYTIPGTFTVILEAIGTGDCSSSDTFPDAIRVFKTPKAAFYPKPEMVSILDPQVEFIDLSYFAEKYEWDFGDGSPYSSEINPVHQYQDTGYYTVRLITSTQAECADTAYDQIRVKGFFTLYVPNSFTPNHDGKNDVFGPLGEGWGKYKKFSMEIFDRWGEMIYQTSDPSAHWNGGKNNTGTICQDGVYLYHIRLQPEDENIREYKGYVMLLR
ncbi:MAG: PKD domain-containing protein [Bacteroidales bacterium]